MPMEASRVTRSKDDARSSYDRMSRWYGLLADRFERRYWRTGLQSLAPSRGEVVLEIGFGTGRCAVVMAHMVGRTGKIHRIDISRGMCTAARSLAEEMRLSERIELTCGDAACLPYGDEIFDAAFMSFSLELFDTPEIPQVLSECKRVLRRGGRVCVVAMSKTGSENAITRLYEWLHVRFPRYVDCRPIRVEESVSAAGFRVMQVRRLSSWGLPVEAVLARKE